MNDRETLLARLDELVADIRSLDGVDALREVVGYISRVVTSVSPEPMPDDVADAVEREVTLPGRIGPKRLPDNVAERLQQIADAPGRRIALDVGDLTEQELDLIADSEIPELLRWKSDDISPLQHVDLLRDFLGLVGADAALMTAKWALMRITELAIEDHGIAIDDIAAEIGETPEQLQRWLDYMIRDVSLDRLAAVYHAIAERAELYPLEWLIGGKPGE